MAAISDKVMTYINGFSQIVQMRIMSFVYADEQQFISFKGYNPEKYE